MFYFFWHPSRLLFLYVFSVYENLNSYHGAQNQPRNIVRSKLDFLFLLMSKYIKTSFCEWMQHHFTVLFLKYGRRTTEIDNRKKMSFKMFFTNITIFRSIFWKQSMKHYKNLKLANNYKQMQLVWKLASPCWTTVYLK